ncbi:MAG TPA: carboxypeptidase regulatory-like domain-containing protein [Armatimonadota bacterium]|jgi:hypothetical protein
MQYRSSLASLFAIGAAVVAVVTTMPARSQSQGPVDLALGKPSIASAIENGLPPAQANDGNASTRWGSGAAGEQFWAVDLGSVQTINTVRLSWEAAYAAGYDIRVSQSALPTDATTVDINDASWKTVFETTEGKGGVETISLSNVSGRSLAVGLHTQGPYATYSLWEVGVYAEKTATISGKVTGPSGALQGAVVQLAGTTGSATATTDAQGAYSFAGLLPGDYTLTAFQSGKLAPVTKAVTAASGQTVTQDIALTLPTVVTPFAFPYFTADWLATDEEPADYSPNFDYAFPTALMPASPATINGVTFALGSGATGAKNVIVIPGTSFLVPAGKYAAINVLASASAGPYIGTVTLNYADGSSQQVPFRVSDWFAAPAAGEREGILVTYRLNANGHGNDGSNIRIFQSQIPVDSTKDLVSFGFSDAQAGSPTTVQAFAFAISLESLAALPQFGTISGTVNGPSGALSGATVTVGPYTLATSATGTFSLPNLPAGNYAVTAFVPGTFAPVTQQVNLTAGGTQTVTLALSAKPLFVQYPLAYTHDWASTHENPGDYNGADTAYPAEELPAAGNTTLNNLQFTWPSTADGANNVLYVDGQTLPIPAAHYTAIHLAESGGWGTMSGPITLTFADGSTQTVSASFTDWFGAAGAKEKEGIVVDHRHSPTDPAANQGARIKIFTETLPISSAKVLTSITLPPHKGDWNNQLGYLWAMTLEALDAPQTGTVTGTVTSASGAVANAVVSLAGFGQVATDAQGKFTIANAPTGPLALSVIAPAGSGLAGATATVTVAAGQTVAATIPALAASPSQVFSRTQASNYESGLKQVESANTTSSVTKVTTAVNESARQIPAAGRMYFRVDPSFAKQFTASGPAYIQVRYLDQGTGTFTLHYTSSDMTTSDMGRYAKAAADTVTLGKTNQWVNHLFTIDDPDFLNMLAMGSSFYVEAAGGPLVIHDVILSKTSSIGAIPNPPASVPGDVSGDGKFNITDIVTALRGVAGLTNLTDAQKLVADVNGDGKFNISDVVMMLRKLAGLIDKFPTEQ